MSPTLAAARLAALLALAVAPVLATPEPSLRPDSLRTYATLHSLGFEWDLAGDADHDATCRVRYRRTGEEAWQPALDLLRVDFQGFFGDEVADRHYNMVAGSVLFLEPGTAYQVELSLRDPDGGGESRLVEVATRPAPVLPRGELTFVHPDTASGDGSRQYPLSLAAAVEHAAPGRLHCLLPGAYGETRLDRSGRPGEPVAWLGPGAARDAGYDVPDRGDAVFTRLEVAASHLWLEGLRFQRGAWPDSLIRGGLRAAGAATDVVVRANRFDGYVYAVWLRPDASDWVITDNQIVGRKDIEQEGSAAFSGEGIELQHSEGHTVAYNAISQVADGISYASRNVDIFGNDIWDTSDDGVEPDYGYANVRIWGNRIANVQYHAFSFQGMFCGPWYFVRNQVTTARGAIFKFRVMDRVVFVNNTLVAPSLARDVVHHLLHAVVRNNLYVRDGVEDSPEAWRAERKYRGESVEKGYYNPDLTAPDWRTDWDYSGYDLRGPDGAAGQFLWFGRSFARVADLARAIGIERHGLDLAREAAFADYLPPTHPARQPRPVLHLRPGGPAVDAGAPLPNLADTFVGAAPDLGAVELGGPEPRYGPRPTAERDRW